MNAEWNERLNAIVVNLRVAPNDQSHWAALYQHLWPFVYAHNRRRLAGDASLAEDITQDVFLKLVRQFGPQADKDTRHTFDEFETPQELCSYLLVASRNKTIDYLRLDARMVIMPLDLIEKLAGVGVSPEESARMKESLQKIMSDLSPADQELARLLITGHQPKEIIRLTKHKWKAGAVYTRLSRLRDRLGALLGSPPTRKDT